MSVTPSLTAPGNQTTGHRLDLDLVWQSVSPTATYELQLARDAGFADLVTTPSGLTGLSYSLERIALAPNTTYYWRVRALEGDLASAWSRTRSFTTWKNANKRAVIYQLAVRYFGNSQGVNKHYGKIEENGVGKFADIDRVALEHLRGMGVTHIWLTGVLRQATNTDYSAFGLPPDDPKILKGRAGSFFAVKDYFDVCPDYAIDVTKRREEFKDLVARIRAAGLKVLTDIVPNHVSRAYDSTIKPELNFGASDDQSKFFDLQNNFFYIQSNDPLVLPTAWAPMPEPSPASVPYTQEDGTPGRRVRVTGEGSITTQPDATSWYETLKLNYGYNIELEEFAFDAASPPATWKRMDQIIEYWQQEMGVDGFRCDMPYFVPVGFWHWVIARAKARRPDTYFLAEAYKDQFELMDAGFDAVYGFDVYNRLKGIYAGYNSPSDLDQFLGAINDECRACYLYYLENHDESRVAAPISKGGFDSMQAGKHLGPLAFLLGPGPVLIHNGQTVGEKGGGNAGFEGDGGRTTFFDYWRVPALADWVNGGLFDGAFLSVEQKNLHEYYRRLLHLVQHPLAAARSYYGLTYLNPNFFVFARYETGGGKLLLVVTNWSVNSQEGTICLDKTLVEELAKLPPLVRVLRVLSQDGNNDALKVAQLTRDQLSELGFPVKLSNQESQVFIVE